MDAFQTYFVDVIKHQYADFDGRARRREYWMYVLFNILVLVAFQIVIGILGVVSDSLALLGSLAYIVVSLGLLVPSIAVAVRRLHDTNKTGWLILIGLIPLAGLVLLYFFVIEGDAGPNDYGPDPKGFEDDLAAGF
ncbi:MAG: DUF805 domain-containing protein [Bacteroidota bacterium]